MASININTATKVVPQCYAYTTPEIAGHDGWTKIGFTERDVDKRIKEQTQTAGVAYKRWWSMRAAYMTEPYGTFTDKDFHKYLKALSVPRKKGTEWFAIDPMKAKQDFLDFAVNHGEIGEAEESIAYVLREEQEAAVNKALAYFEKHPEGEFLWNAKPRFGKTLSAYDLSMRMEAKNILIVTNRPAIANSWYDDYATFFGPDSGYLFVSHVEGIREKPFVMDREAYTQKVIEDGDNVRGCIEFVSLQDMKGSIYFGGIHDKLRELSRESGIVWDLLIVDEAHEGVDTYKTDVAFDHLPRRHTLHLSGTPFKALASGKFPEEAIFNWTYADEQRKKKDWDPRQEQENPYENLPMLSLFTYQMSEIVRDRAKSGIELADGEVQEYAFDLNEFFKTNEAGRFVHDKDVNSFIDALTQGEKFPFSTPALRDELKHTFWILNRVASAKALAKKLAMHPVFKDYEIVLAAGDGKIDKDDEVLKSFDKVRRAISENDRTITLSVGQLTTGVTIPEWSAVLMLSNMASPSLYMQAAFRAQNPCLFSGEKGDVLRKRNAYVFDFDPARTLRIFESFANDLIPETSAQGGSGGRREENVRELLNFFPVYGEDDLGEMVPLDAEAVLSIPRHIHAREVVERGFMSNFLFANISNIFGAPKEVIDLINNMEPIQTPTPLRKAEIDEDTADALHLNKNGEIDIPKEVIIGLAEDAFGENVYDDVQDNLDVLVKEPEAPMEPEDFLEHVKEQSRRAVTDVLVPTAKESYDDGLKASVENRIERKLRGKTDVIVNKAIGEYTVRDRKLEKEREDSIKEAQDAGKSMEDIARIDEEITIRKEKEKQELVQKIAEKLQDKAFIDDATETIVEEIETDKINDIKKEKEGDIRDHLRGFSRTIPAFLMAYGDENTTLRNFDKLVPPEVFWEVTVNPRTGRGVSVEDFRFLRDGGFYYEKDENGREIRDKQHKAYFEGQLFDEIVFDDAVKEFMKKRRELSNYFTGESSKDIFDYIPPQKTNQVFTPKAVVKDMVDRLEAENPGCFDDPDATFSDLYMKSGMYITEIVTRLFQSERMQRIFPSDEERLKHIFSRQVYGCAPTEIIYRICLRYILGFNDELSIEEHNIVKLDTLASAKQGDLQEKLEEVFQF